MAGKLDSISTAYGQGNLEYVSLLGLKIATIYGTLFKIYGNLSSIYRQHMLGGLVQTSHIS